MACTQPCHRQPSGHCAACFADVRIRHAPTNDVPGDACACRRCHSHHPNRRRVQCARPSAARHVRPHGASQRGPHEHGFHAPPCPHDDGRLHAHAHAHVSPDGWPDLSWQVRGFCVGSPCAHCCTTRTRQPWLFDLAAVWPAARRGVVLSLTYGSAGSVQCLKNAATTVNMTAVIMLCGFEKCARLRESKKLQNRQVVGNAMLPARVSG